MSAGVQQSPDLTEPVLADLLGISSAEVMQVMPGLWHLHLTNSLPLVRLACEDGWTELSARGVPVRGLVAGDAGDRHELMLARQASHPLLKYSLATGPRAGAWLGAELPIDLKSLDPVETDWLRQTVAELRTALSNDAATALARVADADAAGQQGATLEPKLEDLSDRLVELGYAVTLTADDSLSVVLPATTGDRRSRIHVHENGWRFRLPLGTDDEVELAGQAHKAIELMMLRIAAVMRFVRPYIHSASAAAAADDYRLGFEVQLPARALDAHIQHAFGGLQTAVVRYETEIESLAVEAILSHAYLTTIRSTSLATRGSARRAAVPVSPINPTNPTNL